MKRTSPGSLASYIAVLLPCLYLPSKQTGDGDSLVLRGASPCSKQALLLAVRASQAEFGNTAQGYRRLEVVLGPQASASRRPQGPPKKRGPAAALLLSFDYRTQGSQLFYYTALAHTPWSLPPGCKVWEVPLFALQDPIGTKRTTGANRCESAIETVLLSRAVVGPDTLVTYAIDQHTSDAPHVSRLTFNTHFRIKQLVYDTRGFEVVHAASCQDDSLITFK